MVGKGTQGTLARWQNKIITTRPEPWLGLANTWVEASNAIKAYQPMDALCACGFSWAGIPTTPITSHRQQPYHEVITPWQRDFGWWLEITIQNILMRMAGFILPKKCLTCSILLMVIPIPHTMAALVWPMNRAVMDSAGTAVLTDEGDTLTLLDRATHHFTHH